MSIVSRFPVAQSTGGPSARPLYRITPRITSRIVLAAALAVGLSSCNSGNNDSSASSDQTQALTSVCGGTIPVSASVTIPNIGRTVTPFGTMTSVGNFPTGGRLSPDGRHYWSVSAGHGLNDVRIVDVASGAVIQTLPLPGSYGQMAFSPDGSMAYVSGEPDSAYIKQPGTIEGGGDAIHVFAIDPITGLATEQDPIPLYTDTPPDTLSYPTGLAVAPDGKTLVVALYHVRQAAIVDLASKQFTTVGVGGYPYAVAYDLSGKNAYVSNAEDGTLSKINIAAATVVKTISGLGGPIGDYNAQPQYLLLDPRTELLYAAVTNHDGVAVVDTTTDTVTQFVSLARPEGLGVVPTALALAPDHSTLYVAEAGVDAVASIALMDRVNNGPKAYTVIGAIPTADYPQDVAVTPNGCTMLWTSARGLGIGPNPGYGTPWEDSQDAPYGTYIPDMLTGMVSILPLPTDGGFAVSASRVANSIIPGDGSGSIPQAPAGSPVVGANGGPSDKIKYVFLLVKENRTYDQIFGSVPRGNGDPSLEAAEDNCGPANTAFEGPDRNAPSCGTTPNLHALSRMFSLLDNFYEDSEVSIDGHMITASSYATNSLEKAVPANYAGRNRSEDIYGPISYPPKAFLFDQAVRQGITFRNYGESTGLVPSQNRSDTYSQVIANTDVRYAVQYGGAVAFGCLGATDDPNYPNIPSCAFDSGLGATPPNAASHIDEFNAQFQQQVANGTVPQFNYLLMPDDHTSGSAPGIVQPLSLIADNDLGVGQLVQIISHSSIWSQSVIFIIEDDSQDGADHVEAHRAPAMVISPWALHGGVAAHAHFDQYSVLRTAELILGMQPLSIYDANATPMYALFNTTADNTPYTAITPERSLTALNPPDSANAALSRALPFDRPDAVPQMILDRLLWQSIYGKNSTPPPPGPGGSRAEHERALRALQVFAAGGDVRKLLTETAPADDDDD